MAIWLPDQLNKCLTLLMCVSRFQNGPWLAISLGTSEVLRDASNGMRKGSSSPINYKFDNTQYVLIAIRKDSNF